eukprot:TRINITY_DN14476_c0_g1_i1.p1 TRINITY_DN14476_c0_g1~~TRINITY_DN14476_c0_g1_i1.p1  ORF type:complete len:270 (-),score=62.33 TRINITY_DN14476_c0_g1_i1:141-950(-)
MGRDLIAKLLPVVLCFTCAFAVLNPEKLRQGKWGVRVSYLGTDKIDTNVHEYKSQGNQDRVVDVLFRNATNLFFVDLASNDAIEISNTVYLESVRNWNGICIEANPMFELGLMSRKCTYVRAVVGGTVGEKVQFAHSGPCGHACGGIVSENTDNKPSDAKHVFTYETVTVQKILDDLEAPRIIDYLSLDIEGMEYMTFKDFPFDRYKFKVMTIERPKKLKDVLDALGYVELGETANFGETLWVHKDYLDVVDMESLKKTNYVGWIKRRI